MKKVKVVLIGAGSGSFGQRIVADFVASEELKSTELTLTLVDVNEGALDRTRRTAERLKEYHGSSAKLEATTNRQEALPGADYVITAVARKRSELWEKDFYVPHVYGFKHVTAECGGPGAAFHTLRSFHLIIPICKDMEELCPDALLLNFTNPANRVCMAVSKLTRIRSVGLCHGYADTMGTVAGILEREREDIDMNIGGLNHFHWVMDIRDPNTGKDLYPQFHRKMSEAKWGLDKLTRHMYDVFGLLPFPLSTHIGEYVSFAHEFCEPYWRANKITLDGEKNDVEVVPNTTSERMVANEGPLDAELTKASGELAVPIICDIEFDRDRKEPSVNIPNEGLAVSNLPEDAIVEIPARVDAQGLHPVNVGPLPEAIAAMCHVQVSIHKLLVETYRERSKQLLLQALLIDLVVDSMEGAQKMMEELLRIEADFLPTFLEPDQRTYLRFVSSHPWHLITEIYSNVEDEKIMGTERAVSARKRLLSDGYLKSFDVKGTGKQGRSQCDVPTEKARDITGKPSPYKPRGSLLHGFWVHRVCEHFRREGGEVKPGDTGGGYECGLGVSIGGKRIGVEMVIKKLMLENLPRLLESYYDEMLVLCIDEKNRARLEKKITELGFGGKVSVDLLKDYFVSLRS